MSRLTERYIVSVRVRREETQKVAGLVKRAVSLPFTENPIFVMPAGVKKIARHVQHTRTTSRAPFLSHRLARSRRKYRRFRNDRTRQSEIFAGSTIPVVEKEAAAGEYSRYTTYWQYRRIGYWCRRKCNFRHKLG